MTRAQKMAKIERLRELRREVEQNQRFESFVPAASVAGLRRRYALYEPVALALPVETNNTSSSNSTHAMSESLESHFRPLDQDVPRDHLVPFQEFGKKLLKTTTINTNALEVATLRPVDVDKKKTVEVDEEVVEEMDVAYNKPFTETNKATRAHHIMVIRQGNRRIHIANNKTATLHIEIEDSMAEATGHNHTLGRVAVATGSNHTLGRVAGATGSNHTLGRVAGATGHNHTLGRVAGATGYNHTSRVAGATATEQEATSNTTSVEKPSQTNSISADAEDLFNTSTVKPNRNEDLFNTTSTTTLKYNRYEGREKALNTASNATADLLHVTLKPPGKSNRSSTGFTLLQRTRGQISSAQQSLARDSGNYTALPVKTPAMRTPLRDSPADNTIVKHTRGNATYKSSLYNARRPKTLKQEAMKKEEVPRRTTERTSSTSAADFQNPTSKILSTAVVTSISVLHDWTPLSPTLDSNSSTAPAQIVHITPRARTRETIVVTFSRSGDDTVNTKRQVTSSPGEVTSSTLPGNDAVSTKRQVTSSVLDEVVLNMRDGIAQSATTPRVVEEVATVQTIPLDDAMLHPVTEATDLEVILHPVEQNATSDEIVPLVPLATDKHVQPVAELSTQRVELLQPVTESTEQQAEIIKPVTDQRKVEEVQPVTNPPVEYLQPVTHTSIVEILQPVTTSHVEILQPVATSHVEILQPVTTSHVEILQPVTTSHVDILQPVTTSHVEILQPVTTSHVEILQPVTTSHVEILQPVTTSHVEILQPVTLPSTEQRPITVQVNEEILQPVTTSQQVDELKPVTTAQQVVTEPHVELLQPVTEPQVFLQPVTTEQEVELKPVTTDTQVDERILHPVFENKSEDDGFLRPVTSADDAMEVTSRRPAKNQVNYRPEDDVRKTEEVVDNDVATYILGTFGLIPVVIAVLLAAKYFISRRKKIWESEKSPLTFVSTNEWEFPRSKLRLQTLLGQGNFGMVYKAEADDILGERATRLVAVKTIKDGASSREKDDLMRELAILKQIGAHNNVVTLFGCCTDKEPHLLIMEYVMYGKLLSFLRDNRTRKQYYNFSEETAELTAKDLTSFAYCVARGMEYLTSKGIIHRDLAARNILVDHNKICKVADFGMSRSVSEPDQIYEQAPAKGALPIRWMAPESLTYRVFTHKSDVWAFGILMWEIVTLGSTPYQSMSGREVIRQVRDGHRLERPTHCRPELYRVAATCWHHDPAHRPAFADIKLELAQLLDQAEQQIYVDLDSYIESINSRQHSTQVVSL